MHSKSARSGVGCAEDAGGVCNPPTGLCLLEGICDGFLDGCDDMLCCCPNGLPVLLPTGVGVLLGFLLGFLDPCNICSGSNIPDTGVPLLD